ncbi:MAG: DUF2029 domain-containing protein [Phycisphaerales bacterium]|nr:DUF2029 domain-containing protein [Phycisphaerales bacterium]
MSAPTPPPALGWQRFIGLPPWSTADDSLRGRWFADRLCVRLGWLSWLIVGTVLSIVVARNPNHWTISAFYRNAASAWWHGTDLYSPGQEGWLYPPQSAILYSPLLIGPTWFGEVLCRVIGLIMLAIGCWRVSRMLSRREWNAPFFLVSTITLGVSGGAFLNGQGNLPLAASMMLACAALGSGRWWWATLWLAVSATIKPPGVVMPMLAFALYPALWWRLPLAGLFVLVMPWVFSPTDPGYATAQYRAGIAKVLEAGGPMVIPRSFADLQSVLAFFGWRPEARTLTLVRAGAALVTLAFAFVARRRAEPLLAAVLIWSLAASYLMVCNPRSEGVGYVIVAPALVLVGLWLAGRAASGWTSTAWRAIGVGLIGSALLMSFVHELQAHSKDFVVRPLLTMIFWGIVAVICITGLAREQNPRQTTP